MILVIKHVEVEGPGTIEDYFQNSGFHLKTIDLSQGDDLPKDLSEIEAVVSLGGPMNVYEEEEFPFLQEENVFIKEIIKKEIPLLGICLGSQLIAKACGARVRKSPVKEVGWFKVGLEFVAESDPLFEGLAASLDVFQWHEDTFDIPSGGVLLVKGGDCPNQAFRIGRSAYGIQFHIEVTEGIIADWCKSYFQNEDPFLRQKAKDMIETCQSKKKIFDKQAELIYKNFAKMIAEESIHGDQSAIRKE